MGSDSASDELLVSRVVRGDADALATLFRRRQQQVYRFVLHVTGSPALADDVTQDVFVTVIREAARFDPGRGAVIAWLCGIARNHVRRRLHADRTTGPLDEDEDGEAPALTPDPLQALTTAERVEALWRAVLRLPLKYREAVVMCDLQEMSYADVAAALECPVGTVRSRLNRGRALLAAKMQTEEHNGAENARTRAPRGARCPA